VFRWNVLRLDSKFETGGSVVAASTPGAITGGEGKRGGRDSGDYEDDGGALNEPVLANLAQMDN
jgi:hypothetical protein